MEKVKTKLEEGLEKGYLEDSIKVLKPVLKAGKMVTDPKHIGYFMWEGASLSWCLPQDIKGNLANPFKSEEERKFFEDMLNLDLNTYKRDNPFWDRFEIRITKDSKLMGEGLTYNMKDPMDNLRARVISLQDEVANSIEERDNYPHKRFLLIGKTTEEKVSAKDMDDNITVFTFLGKIKDSNKQMKEFLSAYYLSKKSIKEVSSDSSSEWMMKEIEAILRDDRKGIIEVINDPNYKTKLLIVEGIKAGAINKFGVNNFLIVGESERKSLNELVVYLDKLKENSDDTYLKIVALIDRNNS